MTLQHGPLKDGDTIALSETGTMLNIRAEVSGIIGSVVFSGVNDLTENVPPYAAWGNDGPDYYAKWQVTPGEYELRALPRTREKGRGKKGAAAVLRFTVVE